MLPAIQVKNDAKYIEVFWDLLPGVNKFRLYWSKNGTPGSFLLVRDNIPNFGTYGKTRTAAAFERSEIGLSESDTLYLAISSVDSAGSESALGPHRIISYVSDQTVDAGALNSPITYSENVSSIIPSGTPTRLKFTHDAKFAEVFNNTAGVVLYVDITGVDATASKSMPVYPYTYYTMFRNLSKDNGVSLISGGAGPVDARIVIHY